MNETWIKTKEDLKNATTEELLLLCNAVRDDLKGKTDQFSEVYGTKYKYADLTNELTRRGCVNRWVKGTEEQMIVLGVDEDKCRITIPVTKKIGEAYMTWVKKKRSAYIYNSAALLHLMEEMESGNLRIKVNDFMD